MKAKVIKSNTKFKPITVKVTFEEYQELLDLRCTISDSNYTSSYKLYVLLNTLIEECGKNG